MASAATERQEQKRSAAAEAAAKGSVPTVDADEVDTNDPEQVSERIRHLQNCPAERTEIYQTSGPRQLENGTTVTVKYQMGRCVDCGESIRIEESY